MNYGENSIPGDYWMKSTTERVGEHDMLIEDAYRENSEFSLAKSLKKRSA